jgi:hypothetical protein
MLQQSPWAVNINNSRMTADRLLKIKCQDDNVIFLNNENFL